MFPNVSTSGYISEWCMRTDKVKKIKKTFKRKSITRHTFFVKKAAFSEVCSICTSAFCISAFLPLKKAIVCIIVKQKTIMLQLFLHAGEKRVLV